MRIGRRGSRRGPKGFTLLEVVVAITILSIGVTATLRAFNGMSQTHGIMKRRLEAMQLANQVLTAVRMRSLSPASDETETEGTFEGSDFRYQISFTDTNWDSLSLVSIHILWGDEEEPSEICLYTLQYYG